MISTPLSPPRNESVLRTMTIAVCVALVCSVLVTLAVQLLRPVQTAYAAIERNRAIVIASGLASAGASDAAIVEAYLKLDIRVMDRRTGAVSDRFDPRTFDHWTTTAENTAYLLPIYIRHDGDRIGRLVLPVDGEGMWSTLRGYLALDGDLNTVAALIIHEHGETPGIGDRIQNPEWLATWQGKRLQDAQGTLRIDVSADAALPDAYRVDAITGATVSTRAVGRMIRERVHDYRAILAALAAASHPEP